MHDAGGDIASLTALLFLAFLGALTFPRCGGKTLDEVDASDAMTGRSSAEGGLDAPGPTDIEDAADVTTPTANLVVLASGQGNPAGMAIDSTNVYWANWNDGTIVKMCQVRLRWSSHGPCVGPTHSGWSRHRFDERVLD